MATKRKILQQLVRDELQWIAQTHELAVEDWRRLDALIDATHVLSKAALGEALLGLTRDRLKQICRHLELDDRGKEKTELVERLLGGHDDGGQEDEDTTANDAADHQEGDHEGDSTDDDDDDDEGDSADDDDEGADEKAEVDERNKPPKPEAKQPLRLFIGSSAESLKVAKRVQVELDHDFDVTVWHQNVFEPGTSTWPQLIKLARTQFDFALFVFGADDEVHSREQSSRSPRDNVLLEYGLFVGALGSKRTFFLYNRDHKPKIASDLAGVTALTYKNRDNLQAALGPACTQLIDVCERLGRRR